MSHFFFFCVSFSPSLLRSFAQHNAHTPSHGRDTCAMLRNTRKATLNGIGTQRKKGATRVRGGKLYLLTLGGVKHTNLRWRSGGVEVAKMRRNPGCRWRCCGVDVDAEAVLTDQRHSKSETGQIKSMPEKLGQTSGQKLGSKNRQKL